MSNRSDTCLSLSKNAKVSEAQFQELLALMQHETVMDFVSKFGPLAVVVSAALAFWGVWIMLRGQRRMARKRATLDVLYRLESDPAFLKCAAAYRDAKKGRNLACLLDKVSDRSNRDIEEEFMVDTYLNHMELLCVAMSEDIIDELFVFQYMRGSIIHDWHVSKDYIIKCRQMHNNPRLHQKLEIFATHWGGELDSSYRPDSPKFVTRSDHATKYMNSNTGSAHTQD